MLAKFEAATVRPNLFVASGVFAFVFEACWRAGCGTGPQGVVTRRKIDKMLLAEFGVSRMTKAELVISLIKYRMARGGRRNGLSEAEAEKQAEDTIREQGLRGLFGGMKALATPDGAIVGNVESYISLLKARGCFKDRASEATIQRVNNEAIMAIEQRRRKFFHGIPDFPVVLADYNYYRTQLEVRAQFGIEPEQMGLDREAVATMTNIAAEYFLKQL